MYISTLGQGETSGVIDNAARIISVNRLFFLERTKAVLMSYLVGVLKQQIPPYYSYYREDQQYNTVQDVVGFLHNAVKDNDWLKLQQTMDELEALALKRTIPQYLMWPGLATADELGAMNHEIAAYFELDKDTGSVNRTIKDIFGIDVSQIGKYAVIAGAAVIGIVLLPSIIGSVRAFQHQSA
jgi:hypothetical protein